MVHDALCRDWKSGYATSFGTISCLVERDCIKGKPFGFCNCRPGPGAPETPTSALTMNLKMQAGSGVAQGRARVQGILGHGIPAWATKSWHKPARQSLT